MVSHWNWTGKLAAGALMAALLAGAPMGFGTARAADSINDPTEADRVLLERAKVAKQIVVEGQAGSLQGEQEQQALQRAQEGWQNMDAAKAAAQQRRQSFEAAKAEAAHAKQEREARYWESAMNMERLLARQQDIEAQRERNLQINQQRTLKEWTGVGEATETGLLQEQQREKVREENLRRYQESLKSGWTINKPQDVVTAQAALEQDRREREQQLLQFTLAQWNQVINVSDEGRRRQEAMIQAQRDVQDQHMQERAREWGAIKSNEQAGVQEQTLREQVRRANADRYQEQLRQDYKASRVGSQVRPAPAGTVPAAAPAAGGTPTNVDVP